MTPAEPRLRSARLRLTAVTVVALAIVMCAGAWVVLSLYREDLTAQLDSRLTSTAAQVPIFSAAAGVPTDVDVNVQAIDADGTVVFSGVPVRDLPALWRPGDDLGPRSVQTSQGRYRTVAVALEKVWVVLAEPMAPLERDVRTLRRSMLIALPLLVAALGIVIWVSVGRTLRPVAAAMERQRRFVVDASHELRSPIAAVRVLVETEPTAGPERAEHRRRALLGLDRLAAITDQLVELGHAENGAIAQRLPVDLDDLAHRAVDRIGGGSGGVVIDTSRIVAGQVLGSETQLESVVDNLLANALRHASRRVGVGVEERDGRALLTVDDDGPGIPASDRERVFERFARLDESRSRTSGGAGLGLAIVRATVEAHGGTVVVESAPEGGCRFVVSLPASTSG